jgi:hypothetical protein
MPVMFSLLEDKVPITLVETKHSVIRAGEALINDGNLDGVPRPRQMWVTN